MKKFISLVLVFAAMLSQGCATQIGYDNSFTAQASRDVKSAMSAELCPWGEDKSDIEVRSRVDVSKDYNSKYFGNSVQKFEEHSGRKRVKCLPKPVPAIEKKK